LPRPSAHPIECGERFSQSSQRTIWVRTDHKYFLLTESRAGSRLANRVQLTSGGHSAYLGAVEEAFGDDVDYAQLVKTYGPAPDGERRYSPSTFVSARKFRVVGKPERKHVSTSFSERNNLNIRMHSRRFTRLTNAFSKKIENHANGVALHFMYYNFVRIHKALRVTPAMAAGVTDKLWEISDVVAMLEKWEAAN
jgi:hypothetical protein